MTELLNQLAADAPINALSKPVDEDESARKLLAKPRTDTASISKTELVLKKLRLAKGATVLQLMEVTGWQQHSVRGFLSGMVRKKLGLEVTSEVGKDGLRRYRIVSGAK